jgi:hypothetical protein
LIKLSKAYSQYGASMGRPSYNAKLRSEVTARLNLTHVRLDSGGYDNGGAYWGSGEPLYRVTGDWGEWTIEFFLRARNREHAKELIRGAHGYSAARFYR